MDGHNGTSSGQAGPGRRWWALGAMVASMLVLGFDMTILNVALPTMARDLGASTGAQQWMADVYIVVFAALMLPAGLLGDRFGRRRMLVAGLGIFLAGSLVGALVHSVALVVVARGVMGVGAALVMPLAMAILPSLFHEPADRAKAVGIISASSALGVPLGPIVGGWLLGHFWWGSIFVLNIPMVAIGITACLLLLPETSDPAAPRIDLVSALCTALGFGSFVYGVNEASSRSWGDPLVLATLAAGVVFIGALVRRGRRQERPLLDMSLLRHRAFLLNTVAATLVMFVMSGLLFLLPGYLQTVLGNSALGTGVRMLPLMGGLIVAARGSGPLVRRFGARGVISGALVVVAFASLLGSRTGVHSGYGFTALWLAVAGIGIGFAMIPAMDAAIGALAKDRAGSGSGLLMTVRQAGSAIGIALLGTLVAGAFAGRLDTSGLHGAAAHAARESVVGAHLVAARGGLPGLSASADAAYVHGLDLALLVCAATALVTALLVAALMPGARAAVAPSGDGPAPGTTADDGTATAAGVADASAPEVVPAPGRARQ
ncbi:DHA2 family efflux MFS transporter permease subunit [Streptomyces fuscigenes]|uniref:DHA2 family efflux MFS transporter permease subunit n=1 Tax=Streptomyces fuscigenes TaxID=1528880 RepID=UPI001F1AF0E7|nr:DHA2 family efflux MFS transporter permease subunit [Streptomyces fuscigenes]MCF3963113.1 DHA2 family efflux MFS transporter permease subunit [Streptomyces fuscigenes]